MNKAQTEKLIDAKKDIDKARDMVSNILANTQKVFNEIEIEYDELSDEQKEEENGSKLDTEKEALQEAIDALQGVDEKFDELDSAINTAME